MYNVYSSGFAIGYIIGILILCCIFGFITKHINESKGYTGGFAWGFFLAVIGIIVVACKPDNRSLSHKNDFTPVSGQSVADEIKKYKELYDQGILTSEEFQTKKEQLLKMM